MIKKLIPCPWCMEWVEGYRWKGASVTVYEHKGHQEGLDCHFKLVLEDRTQDRNNE